MGDNLTVQDAWMNLWYHKLHVGFYRLILKRFLG